jgi:hypothetical protein
LSYQGNDRVLSLAEVQSFRRRREYCAIRLGEPEQHGGRGGIPLLAIDGKTNGDLVQRKDDDAHGTF